MENIISPSTKVYVHNETALHLGAASRPFTVKYFLLTMLRNSSMQFHVDIDIAFSS